MKDITTPLNPNRARYLLASATQRFLARVVDIFLINIVVVGISLAIVYVDNYNWDALALTDTWRYFFIAFATNIISFLYFICLPYWFKNQTIGQKIFKLETYRLIPTKNFIVCLLRREFCVWVIIVLINLALGIVLWLLGSENASKLLHCLLRDSNESGMIRVISILFQTAYAIAFLILLFVIIHMFINTKRRCFIDHISDTCVIKLVDVNSDEANAALNAKKIKSKRNYGLPGEVTTGMSDEIDSL